MSAVDVGILVFLGVGGLVCLLLGVLALRSALRQFQLTRRMAGDAATPVDVADVTRGTVAVSGTARPAEEGSFPAPFADGEALVAVAETLERGSAGQHGSTGPTTDERATETVPFVVEDGTGSIRVEPDAGSYHGERERFDPEEVDRSALEAWLDRTDVDEESSFGYRQRVAAPGDEVYVFGDAVATDGGGAGGGETDVRIADGGDVGDVVVSTEGRGAVGGASLVSAVALLFFGGLLLFFSLGFLLALVGRLV